MQPALRLDQRESVLNNTRNRVLSVRGSIKLRKTPKWLYPSVVENRYTNFVNTIVNSITKNTVDIVIKNLSSIIDEAGISERTDSWPDSVNRLIDNLRIEVNSDIVNTQTTLIDIGQKTSNYNDAQWRKIMTAVMGVNILQNEPWLNDQLTSWTNDNIKLITSLKEETYKNIDGIVSRGIRSGKRVESITDDILRTKGFEGLPVGPLKKAKNRARLIARDQISKLNGSLTRLRQTGIGLKEYTWRTSRDERVRDSHGIKEGKKFGWDKPPIDTGHPGEDYQCRCWADPDFAGILEEIPETAQTQAFKTVSIEKEQAEIAGLFDRAQNKQEIIKVLRDNPAFLHMNLKSFQKLVENKDLQMGLFKMRAGNLLTAAIRRSKGLPAQVVKKVVPVVKVPTIVAKPVPVVKPVAAPLTKDQPVLTESAFETMSSISKNRFETLQIYDKDFNILTRITQHKKSSVTYDLNDTVRKIVVHNHPAGMSFSPADICNAIVSGRIENIVVTKKHVFKMSGIKQKNVSLQEVNDMFKEEMKKQYGHFYKAFEMDKKHIVFANQEMNHNIVKAVAKRLNFTYERMKIENYAATAKKSVKSLPIKITKELKPTQFDDYNTAQKWLSDNFDDVVKTLDKKEMDALDWYKSPKIPASKQINNTLRGVADIDSEWQRDLVNRRIPLIKNAINKGSIKEDIVVYRAMSIKNFPDEDITKSIGSHFTEKGFLSASLIKSEAKEFVNSKLGQFSSVKVIAKMKIPKGTKAILGNKWESELILQSGRKMKITDAKKVTGYNKSNVWEIGLELL